MFTGTLNTVNADEKKIDCVYDTDKYNIWYFVCIYVILDSDVPHGK